MAELRRATAAISGRLHRIEKTRQKLDRIKDAAGNIETAIERLAAHNFSPEGPEITRLQQVLDLLEAWGSDD